MKCSKCLKGAADRNARNMGKRGNWFSAIKRVFLPHSKDKLANESLDRKNSKEKKKKGLGKLRHGETSFIPLFRGPSSIEQILDEAEREHRLIFRPPTPSEPPRTPSFVPARVPSPRIPSQRITSPRDVSPKASASPIVVSPRVASPRIAPPRPASPKNIQRHRETYYRPEPTPRNHHASATKIQAAYRGYMARRSFRALKGLVRLQGVIRGQSVKRQTMNALKYMQLLVRVQSQIRSRRIQMLENQVRHQVQSKEVESTLGKLSQTSGAGSDWDYSMLTKEEIEARLHKKVEAVVKRERAMSYAFSHQLWKSTPKSALTDIRSNGFPWWWNWLERQLPPTGTPDGQVTKNFQLTPPRPHSEMKPSPRPPSSSSNRQPTPLAGYEFNVDTPTPRSTRSAVAFVSSRQSRTPTLRTPQPNNSSLYSSRARAVGGVESPFNLPLKDDDSLTSCPPFTVPNYMTPTVSAKAKARPTSGSNPKERFPPPPGTPSSEKRRLSFPLSQGIGSFKWNKGSFFSSNKDSTSQKVLDKHHSLHSVGNLSVDSTVSMPATVGRKPFNRFV